MNWSDRPVAGTAESEGRWILLLARCISPGVGCDWKPAGGTSVVIFNHLTRIESHGISALDALLVAMRATQRRNRHYAGIADDSGFVCCRIRHRIRAITPIAALACALPNFPWAA